MKYNIGFMQGRLSPIQGKKIQSFPWKNWKKEFQIGRKLNFRILEWTLDFKKKSDFFDRNIILVEK